MRGRPSLVRDAAYIREAILGRSWPSGVARSATARIGDRGRILEVARHRDVYEIVAGLVERVSPRGVHLQQERRRAILSGGYGLSAL
jgi:hypothetical protein